MPSCIGKTIRLVGQGVFLCGGLALASPPAHAEACATLIRAMTAAPQGPVFLASYPTIAGGPLHDTAFLYDNAAASIALVGCGKPDLARRIGDAIVYALHHDRFWHDGRLRNAYAAGAVGPGAVKLAGWWEEKENRWVEDRYQVGSDTGNLAWAMLALLALDDGAADRRYRDAAAEIGTFLQTRRDPRGNGGFTGGTFGFEPTPQHLSWKSTEHNADLAAAFGRLVAKGDTRWANDARIAATFVRAQWMPTRAAFAAGTGDDGVRPNPMIALDAQVWSVLALKDPAIDVGRIDAVLARLQSGSGYAYDESRGGAWSEGTASVALVFGLSMHQAQGAHLSQTVEDVLRPQGVLAATGAGAATGLGLATDPMTARRYFAVPHLAATAWLALAQTHTNPFSELRPRKRRVP